MVRHFLPCFVVAIGRAMEGACNVAMTLVVTFDLLLKFTESGRVDGPFRSLLASPKVMIGAGP